MKKHTLSRIMPILLLAVVLLVLLVFYGLTLRKDTPLQITETNLAASAEISGNVGSKFAFDQSAFTSWIVSKKGAEAVLMFEDMQEVNALLLNENGFNVRKFSVYYHDGTDWKLCYRQNEIGQDRLATFYPVQAKGIKIVIEDFKNLVSLNDIKVYCLNPKERTKPLRITSYVTPGSLAEYDPETGVAGKISSDVFDVITDVQFIAYGTFTADGSIKKEPQADTLSTLKEMIGERDVRIHLTVFPTRGSSMADMLRNHMEDAIESVVTLVNAENVAGVDFDWEYPQGKEEYALYSDFIVKLSNELHKNGKTLSIALSPWGLDFSEEAVKAIDQVQIMAYDLFDHNGDNNSYAGSCESAVQYMLAQGFTLEQLNLGISYYGRPSDASGVWVDYNHPDYTQDPYIMVENGIYFNSITTVRDKTVYSIQRGLGGIMTFSQHEDLPFEDPLSLTAQIGMAREAFSKEENHAK